MFTIEEQVKTTYTKNKTKYSWVNRHYRSPFSFSFVPSFSVVLALLLYEFSDVIKKVKILLWTFYIYQTVRTLRKQIKIWNFTLLFDVNKIINMWRTGVIFMTRWKMKEKATERKIWERVWLKCSKKLRTYNNLYLWLLKVNSNPL